MTIVKVTILLGLEIMETNTKSLLNSKWLQPAHNNFPPLYHLVPVQTFSEQFTFEG